jgi:hypothetical protein
MKKLIFIVFLSLAHIVADGQELNCTVQVNAQQIQGVDRALFTKMQQSIFEFLNQQRWTGDTYQQHERIECSFLFNISEMLSQTEFKGTLTIQSRRPVYGTNYNTTVFTHNDKDIHFKFEQFEALVYSETTYASSLTAILGFYANFILGLDYDTFSPEGGSEYFRKALSVVNTAQSASERGWKSSEQGENNRYWLIENHLNAPFKPLRACLYQYHRLGLDVMSTKPEEGRTQILEALKQMEKVHVRVPLAFNTQVFFTTKVDEIVNVFSESTPQEKGEVVQMLNRIDPSNQNKYLKIMKSE